MPGIDLFAEEAAPPKLDLFAEEPTFFGAVGTGLKEGLGRMFVGGAMQAAGDALDEQPNFVEQTVQKFSEQPVTPFGLVETGVDYARGKVVDLFKEKPPAVDLFQDEAPTFAENLRGAGKELGDESTAAIKAATPDDLGFWGTAALSATESAAQVLPTLALARTGLISKPFATGTVLGGFTGQSFTNTYHDMKAKGTGAADALTGSLLSAGAEYAGERFAFDTLLKGGKGWLGKFLLQEVGGEEFTTIVQSLAEKRFSDPEKWSTAKEIINDLLMTAASSAMGAGVISGVNKGFDLFDERQQKKLEGVKREVFEDTEVPTRFQRSVEEALMRPAVDITPLTPAEERTATIIREQLKNGLDVPPIESQSVLQLNDVVAGILAKPNFDITDTPALDEGGVTPEVLATRKRNYVAMEGTPDTWPILASRDGKATGLTMGQIGEAPPGSVFVIGRDDDNWDKSVTEADMETAGVFIDKFLPGSRVVIMQIPFAPGKMQEDSMGYHEMRITDTGPIHFIIPRDTRNIKQYGVSDFRTALNRLFGLKHEFGHGIEQQGFWEMLTERVGPQLAQQFFGETLNANYTEQTLAAIEPLAPQEVALTRNWLEQRSRMLDGTMLAREYLETWAGVRKVGAAIAPNLLPSNKSLYRWAEQRAEQMGMPLDGMTAKELLIGAPTAQHTIGDMREMLRLTSFSEYMAEQFTRAAYAKGYLANTPLGRMFQTTLDRLRELFRFLKTTKGENAEPLIAAHTTYQEWLNSLTARAAKMKKPKGTVKLTSAMKAARKKILAKKTVQQEVDEVVTELEGEKEQAPPPEQVPPSKEDEHAPQGPTLMELVTAATDPDNGWIKPGSMEEARLHGMVKRGKIEQVMEILDNGHFDKVQAARRYASHVFSLLPNKEQIKRETIQATLRRAEIKAAEKAAWEEILEENQEKTLSREELAKQIEMHMIPLQRGYTDQYANFGVGALKLPTMKTQTVLLTTPWVTQTLYKTPGEAEIRYGNHFNHPDYVMHYRRGTVRTTGKSYILELQSDLFQQQIQPEDNGLSEDSLDNLVGTYESLRNDLDHYANSFRYAEKANPEFYEYVYEKIAPYKFPVEFIQELQKLQPISSTTHWLTKVKNELDSHIGHLVRLTRPQQTMQLEAMAKDWNARLIKEILADHAELGVTSVNFPTADTVAKIEGWNPQVYLPEVLGEEIEINGDSFYLANGHISTVLSGEQEPVLIFYEKGKPEDLFTQRTIEFSDTYYIDNFPVVKRAFDLMRKKANYGASQGIYDRYKRVVEKLLISKHKAIPTTDKRGNTWLEVSVLPTMEEIYHWDKTNPVQPRLPEVGVVDFAGLTNEELMKPEMIALASMMYKSQGTNSPFFLRWYRDGVRDREAQPLKVFRGSHSPITFLDRESLGYHTGAEDATKAFWASDSLNNASYYAEQAGRGRHQVAKAEHRREQQRLRKAVNDARELLRTKTEVTKAQREKLWNALGKAEMKLQDFVDRPDVGEPASPSISELYLRLENPLQKDAEGSSYDEQLWTSWVNEAILGGHDGLIIKNALDPRPGTVYAFFKPEQAKDLANVGTFDDTDRLHWDRDQPVQNTAASTVDSLKGWLDLKWQQGLNLAAKASDSLVQLQQTAAAQPEEAFLNGFVGLLRRSSQMASDLQFPAEETVAKMIRSTPHTVNELQRIMTNEWKGGILMGELQGLDENGQVVWGAEVGRGPENLQNAIDWRVADSIGLREFLTKEGVDVESAAGEKIIELYLGVRNTFLHQFRGLEIALREKASRAYGNAPLVLRQEYFKIDQLISKYRILPFLPQGHFGNHVVLVMKKRSWEEAKADNRRRFVTVRRMHFESKAEADKAFIEMKKLEAGGEYRVRTRVLDDSRYGIPMQLPREFLENVAATGEFDDDQIDLLADLMVTGKYERIEAKYDKISEKLEGGNEDFKRVFSNFTWHNANYVWKTYYRSAMQNMLSMARTEVRQLERSALPAEEIVKLVGKKRRNIRMMESSLNYIMHPENELQGMKLMITLTYLAFNVKTAVMNLSTQLNTFAALGTEYGEWKGANLYKKGLWYTANAFRLTQMSGEGKTASEKEAMDVRSMIDQAVRQGVLDQSYAYFLAGQANAGGSLSVSSNSWLGRVAHVAMEGGMLPFRMTEKANRYSTLISFYLAERGQGIDGVRAYETAVKKVDLLQNSYSQGNRPELFRGKKGIFFMFASFAQFQGWVMTGGYERSARAGAKAEGRNVRSVWAGTTMKLWLFYLMLGGGLDLPFAENLLDLAKFVWRRLFGNPENLEVELRAFIKDLGGDPNLALHGLFHNFLGFNLSGSFGLGRLLPFTDVLNRQFSSVDAAIGKGVTSFAGPAGNFYGSVLAALGQLAQGEPLEAMKEMPGAIGAVGKTADAIIRQNLTPGEGMGVRLKNGTRLTKDPETGEFRDLTGVELAGMAMSAVPALVAENRQLAFAQQGEVLYWNMRRQELKEKYRHARMEGDEKATDIWRDKIDQFNETIPDHNLRITGKELAEGVKAQRKSARAMENYGTMQRKMRGVVGEVGEGY